MKKLIVGIDPGITTAFCALDLNGNLVSAFSSKKLGLENLIAEIRKVGTPIVISCDVKIAPAIVQKVAAIFRAKLITPQEDMKSGEKRNLYSKFKLEDIHQKDACAAAVFAFNRYRLLFSKVEAALREANKSEKAEDVKAKLILGFAKSIKDALVEKPLEIMLQPKKRTRELFSQSKESLLGEELKKARSKIDELEKENKKLKDRIEWLELVVKPKGDVSKIAELRKITIENLEDNIKKLGSKAAELNSRIVMLKKALRHYKQHDIVLITEINDLSNFELEKLGDADFKNCLLVKELTLPGAEALEKMQELQIQTILYKKTRINVNGLAKLKFYVLPAEEIEIKNNEGIVYVDKAELDALVNKQKVKIEELIAEYREKRS